MHKPDARARGVLHTPDGTHHGRLVPSSARVADYVEHFWWVRWRLAVPRSAEVLSYPSVHVVFESGDERIVGVVRAKFVRRLVGKGEVFGIKFRPGMFRPLVRVPVDQFTDRVRPVTDQFGDADLGAKVRSQRTMGLRARAVERALERVLPPAGPRARLARDLVEQIQSDRRLHSISALAESSGLTERALQRLFKEFVGVTPKWVVRRFRLQEAAELLATTTETIASVAAALGYFDQAHFARDFKSVVGQPPIQFQSRNRPAKQGDHEGTPGPRRTGHRRAGDEGRVYRSEDAG